MLVDAAQADVPFRPEIRCDLIDCGCRYGSLIWVSHSKKAIYFEIPKTGCTSIKSALGIDPRLHRPIPEGQNFEANDAAVDLAITLFEMQRAQQWIRFLKGEVFAKYPHRDGYSLSQILSETIEALADELDGNKKEFNGRWRPAAQSPYGFSMYFGTASQAIGAYPDYFKFAVVWEPLKRLHSCWRMFCHRPLPIRTSQLKRLFSEDTTRYDFSGFLRRALEARNHHWESCVAFLPGGEASTNTLDWLITLPDLNTDWLRLADRLDLNPDLQHLNRSQSHQPEADLNEAECELIKKEYAADYRLLFSVSR